MKQKKEEEFKKILLPADSIITEAVLEAIEEFLTFTAPAEVRKSVLSLFFYNMKYLEKEGGFPLGHESLVEDIQFLIRLLDSLELLNREEKE